MNKPADWGWIRKSGGGGGGSNGVAGRREDEGEEEEEEFSGGHTLAWIGGGLWVQSRYGEAPRTPLTPVTLIKYIVAGTQTPTVYLELYRCRGAP